MRTEVRCCDVMGKDWFDGCWRDRKWRLNHLYWIEVKSGPPRRFRMNWAQEELFDNLWTRNQVLKARQLGISTLTSIYILDSMLFEANFHAGIIDKSLPDATEKLGKIRFALRGMLRAPAHGVDYVEDAADREMINAWAREMALLMCFAVPEDEGNDKKFPIKEQKGRLLNGSSVRVGTSMRGGTLKFLHVSEFGWKAAHRPWEAREVVTGALNSVSADCVVVMESTHEGGKVGLNYARIRTAMRNIGKKLNKLEERFFFFPWWKEGAYRLPVDGGVRRYEGYVEDYFRKLEDEGIMLDEGQRRWYAAQWESNGMAVRQEYPSTPGEALESQVEGAIYGREIDSARMDGRLEVAFDADDELPLYVSWDLGLADWTSLWLFQPRRDGKFSVLDCFSANRQRPEFFAGVVRRWEAVYGQVVKMHFVPHDGRVQRSMTDTPMAEWLRMQGMMCTALTMTRSVYDSIQKVRRFLRHCVFHERCSEASVVDGEEFMSGLNALENYQWRPVSASGEQSREPLHNDASHPADGFRYFVEAYEAGLVTMYGVRQLLPREGVPVRRVARGASWRR